MSTNIQVDIPATGLRSEVFVNGHRHTPTVDIHVEDDKLDIYIGIPATVEALTQAVAAFAVIHKELDKIRDEMAAAREPVTIGGPTLNATEQTWFPEAEA